jgi:glycosyltransferase involved in cell wall biosynthesis
VPGALVVSALVPYKRIDLAIDACRRARVPLKIVGRGPEEGRLKKVADEAAVEFLGWRNNEEIRSLYQGASVVLLPGIEDFGIVPVEAQACGTPVVALASGGACETVVDGETGVLVPSADADAFAEAIRRVIDRPLDRGVIRRNAERFSVAAFKEGFQAVVDDTLAGATP